MSLSMHMAKRTIKEDLKIGNKSFPDIGDLGFITTVLRDNSTDELHDYYERILQLIDERIEEKGYE